MNELKLTFFGARIDSAEQHNGKFYTVITMPAPDAFSHPSKFKLTSAGQIGPVNSVVDVQVVISGMVRQRNYFDKQTGHQKSFQEPDVFLNVVSATPHVAEGKK